MTTRIALLRAVNVAGRTMKMERLRTVLTEAGYTDVATHIQTGNVRFTTTMRSDARITTALEKLLAVEFGFDTSVVLCTPADLDRVVAAADALPEPFPGVLRQYVTFCRNEIDDDARTEIEGVQIDGERLVVSGREVHWWLAKSAHDAKMSNAWLERRVGVATTRDLRVVRAMAQKWGTRT